MADKRNDSVITISSVNQPSSDPVSSTFKQSPSDLLKLIDPKDPERYASLGYADGLAALLHTDIHHGLSTAKWALSDSEAEKAGPRQRTSSSGLPGLRRARKSRDSLPGDHLDPFAERKRVYGTNELPEPVAKGLLAFMWDALKDKTLIVLCIAAAIEVAVGIYKMVWAPIEKRDSYGIIDGAAIIVAVLIVVLVSAVNDYRKQGQFRKITSFSKTLNMTKCIRDNATVQVNNTELMVGDIIIIQVGDVLPADGILVHGFSVETDESSLTGEAHAIHKDLIKDPFLLSGTKVTNGQGRMIVIAVGCNSMNGRTLLALEVELEETPLQQKLGRLADDIAKYGLLSAVAMVVLLLIFYFAIKPPTPRDGYKITNDIIAIFISAITLIVVAVPEGLPLAVTIALAHATVRMLKDNNLVRHLSACETMGNATTICSDKTGTLTLNRMTVVQGAIAETAFALADLPDVFKASFLGDEDDRLKKHKERIFAMFCQATNVNSSADEVRNQSDKIEFVGSKTEIATLMLTQSFGYSYKVDRERSKIVGMIPFSSDRKRMATVVKTPHDAEFETALGLSNAHKKDIGPDGSRYWMFVKGAAEIVLKASTMYVGTDGRLRDFTPADRARQLATIDRHAIEGYRTLCVAFKPTRPPVNDEAEIDSSEDSHSLILLATLAIQDPVRPEVPDAVLRCQKAGITVRMVTGDNVSTATTIAKECGILGCDPDEVIMEGPVFRALPPDEMDATIPHLRVLARSSPLDKQILVKALKRLGETVAVTGDGTNDAPALKAADVGFGMGVGGTEVAKEASDIVILDDNFASIVRAVIWGRSVYDSVRKFLQFQLTVNVTAVVLTILTSIITTVTGDRTPNPVLTAVQLLWVNLIMDTLAALALATDPPSASLLDRPPAKRCESIVSWDMRRMIVGQAVYQIVACLALWATAHNVGIGETGRHVGSDPIVATLVFNAFVFMQVFNEVNCRSITRDFNIFKGITKNTTFVVIVVVTVGLQIIIVEFGGKAFHTTGLNLIEWAICIAAGFGSIPMGALVRILPDFPPRKPAESEIPTGMKTPTFEPAPSVKLDKIENAESNENNNHGSAFTRNTTITSTAFLVPEDSSHPTNPDPTHPCKHRWSKAIHHTTLQIRVVNAFRYADTSTHSVHSSSAPSIIRTSPSSASVGPAPITQQQGETQYIVRRNPRDMWEKARDVPRCVGVVNAFRGGRRRGGVDVSAVGLQIRPREGSVRGV